MTDRELLEWAAKAAGYRIVGDVAFGSVWVVDLSDAGENEFEWNPRGDDGDALRLAVKLSIFDSTAFHHYKALSLFGTPEHDPYAATRRAIVRAAAAIGQSLAATSSGDSR